MQIGNYLSENSVMFLNSNDKNEVLSSMAVQATKLGYISNEQEFINALIERESIMSTDIGWEVAIPHAKLKDIPDFFVIPAVLKDSLDWGAGDDQKVRLVFLIGGPAEEQKQYLQILSKITLIIRNKQRRKALLEATTAAEVLAQFEGL